MNETKVADEREAGTASQSLEERRRIIRELFAKWGYDPNGGDNVDIEMMPGETRGEAALRAIQESFAASGVSEEEFQESGRQIREELYQKYYGGK